MSPFLEYLHNLLRFRLQSKWKPKTWWRHQMENSPLREEFSGDLWIPLKKASEAWTSGCANNRNAGDLGRHRTHYCITVMNLIKSVSAKEQQNTARDILGFEFKKKKKNMVTANCCTNHNSAHYHPICLDIFAYLSGWNIEASYTALFIFHSAINTSASASPKCTHLVRIARKLWGAYA